MKRIVKALCAVILAAAAIPAALGAVLLWAAYRLTDRLISLTERSRNEG